MNVSIFPENGEWLLVLNPIATDQSEAEMGEAPPPVSAFEKCWTGEHWTDAPSEGQRYESKSDAATYLHEHWQRMENMAEALHDPIPTEFPIRGL
jgi:hypothetical protein